MDFFLYHRSTRITGAAIARALGLPHGDTPPRWDGTLIRWGSRVGSDAGFTRVINPSQAIRRASDKLDSLRVLREAGVLVPDWTTDPEEIDPPFLGRRIRHARGSDIVLCLQRSDWGRRSRDYYTKYVPTVREFRIHIFDGAAIRVQGKYADYPELAVKTPWVRNYASGYRFRSPNRNIRPSRVEVAAQAVRALGLTYGAVDLVIGDDDREYVLEVNTAAACSPLTASAYVTAFQRMLGIPTSQLVPSSLEVLATVQEGDDGSINEEGEESYA